MAKSIGEMKVLVVDDYGTMLKIQRNLLKGLGFVDIDEAKDGSQAIQMCQITDYDLIISDWNMEPMTGLQFLRWVREEGKNKTVPFIMVTAEAKQENVLVAAKAGVSNYIVKPFNAETLKEKIAKVVPGLFQ